MKKNTQKPKTNVSSVTPLQQRVREALVLAALAIAGFLLLALVTYHALDPSWSHVTTHYQHIHNAGGIVGAWLADVFLYILGYIAYLLPIGLLYLAWLVLRQRWQALTDYSPLFWGVKALGFTLVMLTSSGLLNLHTVVATVLPYSAGGLLGHAVSWIAFNAFGLFGGTLLLTALLLVGVTLLTGLSWLAIAEKVGRYTLVIISGIQAKLTHCYTARRTIRPVAKQPRVTAKSVRCEPILEPIKPQSAMAESFKSKLASKLVSSPLASKPKINEPKKPKQTIERFDSLPSTLSLSLLDPVEAVQQQGYTREQLETLANEVELRLKEFSVAAKVVAVHPGPVVTRFELDLAAGTKASKITNLARDLARSLSMVSVRVVEVIPGKSVVGLELPNKNREMVRLRELIASKTYHDSTSPLTLVLGKDIAGHPSVADLAKMPHLLVAGTTGSGKSVGLNAMLLSLLYKSSPNELRMILIDPKMLELSVYDGIPHLLAPVVTDMKDAAKALRWCVMEMERRYKLMAHLGVRNIAGYNKKIKRAEERGESLKDPFWQPNLNLESEPAALTELPYIVVLADEFADMIMVVGKKVEELIARLAQKARAAGIHLILATQRPSVDVITGLIKANVPTRIAFQVSSKIDSRTVLDQAGAEQLLGHGDMLYLAPGTGVPVRVHGAFVADEEVHRVTEALKAQAEPQYVDAILEGGASSAEGGFDVLSGEESSDAEQDPLYDQAAQIVIDTRRASISSIQRRLKIGYNRAARIVEAMEEVGLVSPMQNNGQREVLVQKR